MNVFREIALKRGGNPTWETCRTLTTLAHIIHVKAHQQPLLNEEIVADLYDKVAPVSLCGNATIHITPSTPDETLTTFLGLVYEKYKNYVHMIDLAYPGSPAVEALKKSGTRRVTLSSHELQSYKIS